MTVVASSSVATPPISTREALSQAASHAASAALNYGASGASGVASLCSLPLATVGSLFTFGTSLLIPAGLATYSAYGFAGGTREAARSLQYALSTVSSGLAAQLECISGYSAPLVGTAAAVVPSPAGAAAAVAGAAATAPALLPQAVRPNSQSATHAILRGADLPKVQLPAGANADALLDVVLNLSTPGGPKDRTLVPRAEHADLVMTPTTRANYLKVASAWLLGRPVLLEGPTGAGKTSLVRYGCHRADAEYVRLNMSYYTEVEDLLGRYVAAETTYDAAYLQGRSAPELDAIRTTYGLPAHLTRDQAIKAILKGMRWVDGPIVKAAKRGQVVLLDEINLARAAVLECLNSLFDDDDNLVLTAHHNETVTPHRGFRFFATMNPSTYAGREPLSEAMRSRWNHVVVDDLDGTDLRLILQQRYGSSLPVQQMAQLISTHVAFSNAAADGLGRKSGGAAYTVRSIVRVADRFIRFRGGELSDDAVLARETREVYMGGFDGADLARCRDILKVTMPCSTSDFYDQLEVVHTAAGTHIGDVFIPCIATGSPRVPAANGLVLTRRTKEILYRLAKALEMGENVALVGEAASGKTAIAKTYAGLRGQPYYRQLFTANTDALQLIGGYNDLGWQDGLLLNAGRPENLPGVLLADEFNLANPAVLERLNSVLDDERKVLLAEKEGEEVRLHPDFRFIAAMNPPTKSYTGRQKLSVAMQNRFTQVCVPPATEAAEQQEIVDELGEQLHIAPYLRRAMVNLHQWATAEFGADGDIGRTMSPARRPVFSLRQLLHAMAATARFTTMPEVIAALAPEAGLGDVQQSCFVLAVQMGYAGVQDPSHRRLIVSKARELAVAAAA